MAETVTVNVPNKHTKLEARRRIEDGFGTVQEQIAGKGVQVDQMWSGDRLDFKAGAMGQNITGHLIVRDDDIHIEVDLPWILAKLSGGIKEKLTKGTQLLLDKK
ncbi:polyhydroxyalkanoic acid system family protein [Ahrensia sp. R2A130]|uniref:polyhydroxyalkanoic acid system family protein n=1 Tax=Ahrensia sp. R2A130 TaxID=744979 RepID=UPI0001E09C93|nr:polyhydroxyalkanoic acid system family protein [Ahrensia sp. R2A130]EFL88392.1 conserved hypothetical protein [Ahrensia sp. R2A130]